MYEIRYIDYVDTLKDFGEPIKILDTETCHSFRVENGLLVLLTKEDNILKEKKYIHLARVLTITPKEK